MLQFKPQLRAMEADTIQKNEASPKSLTSRIKFLIFALILSSASISAQDVITLRNGDQIQARVTEVSQTEIRFKRFDNLEGPTRVIPRADVFAINYENGTRDVFNPLTETNVAQTATQQPVIHTNQRQQQPVNQRTGTQTRDNTNLMNVAGGNLLLAGNEIVLFGIGAKYQRFVSETFRIEASFSYFIPRTDRIELGWGIPPIEVSVSLWDLSANAHFLVSVSDNVVWYPLVGLCISGIGGRMSIGGIGESDSETFFGINIGTGMDFRLSETLTLNVETKFNLFDFSELAGILSARVGLSHRF